MENVSTSQVIDFRSFSSLKKTAQNSCFYFQGTNLFSPSSSSAPIVQLDSNIKSTLNVNIHPIRRNAEF